jgi:glycerol-3-phosphate dehydrogenase subunit C
LTTTYDPHHPSYLNETDLRGELTRVYDLCHGCRLCFKFCSAFPSLFEMVDRDPEQDAATLTAAEQDRVVDECFNCKLCYVNCPYTPGQSDWNLDFPRLMLRAKAVRHTTATGRQKFTRERMVTNQVLGRTDLLGKLNTTVAPLVNAATGTPGSIPRKIMERVVGVASERILPPYTRVRFTTWFNKRGTRALGQARRAEVAVFPTCVVEYQRPEIGHDLVKVYERNGISCSLAEGASCCGAPWLHSGDIGQFTEVAKKNVAALADAVRQGKDIVVPQPTCGYTLKKDYVDYVGGADAELVAQHTFDAAEYLMKVHKENGGLDTDFGGEVPATVTYHVACHLKAQNVGLKSRDLMKLTGAKIQLAPDCSGIDGTWGYRAENFDMSKQVSRKLGATITKQNSEVVTGDCSLANESIREETGRVAQHPISMVARAYGIPVEPTK